MSKLLTNHQVSSSFSQATLAFLSHLGPRDFATGAYVTIGPAFPDETVVSVPSIHHIYPRDFLKSRRVGSKRHHGNALMNMCLLPEATNQRIGAKSPAEYFAEYSASPDFPKIIASHLIPMDFATRKSFKPSDFAAFLKARADLFIEALGKALPDVTIRRG